MTGPGPAADTPGEGAPPTTGELATLYLGNILYAIELAAIALAEQGKPEDAAFYRALGRELAESHARGRPQG
ncbi:MAG: hypothetical protein MUF21_05250 [Gemmatimonadaceae bacterium]|jgi:hypothetical protein|nr:hypothetical protein [Gemmatimonadaceae bacterium]